MISQILTGAGIGIFAGYSIAMCGGILSLLVIACGILAGCLLNLKLREYRNASLFAVLVLILCRTALFIYPFPDAVPLVSGLICGMTFGFQASSAVVLKSMAFSGIISCICGSLFVSGSGEACLAFICGGASMLSVFFKDKERQKFAMPIMLVLLLSIFPAGALSKSERLSSVSKAVKLQRGVCEAMILPKTGVANTALIAGDFAQETANVLTNFPGVRSVKTVRHYMQLYPVFDNLTKKRITLYPVVFVNGNGRMCRLASRYVAPGGVLVIPEDCVKDVPRAFRHWSELGSSPGFIVLSKDFVIDCSESCMSKKMKEHINNLGLQKTIPAGVCEALFDHDCKPAGGIRESSKTRQINYTLWFFGLVAGVYLFLRLIVFSRFDKGERRWTALENTFSTILLLLLLKKFPDTLCTAMLPAAVFFILPAFKITGRKNRILQLSGAALCILSIFIPELLNAAQAVAVICCGTMWNRLRREKDAVMSWVDSCSITGILLGIMTFALLNTLSAPVIFVVGTTLLLRSNILFRSL